MRVISQDGSIDIPYENFVLGITKDNYIIATRDTIASPSEIVHGVVAKYSTKEKAMKVMEMVRKRYAKFIFFQTTYQNGVLEKLTKELGEDEALNIVTPIFRFPKDEEVEV